MKNFASRYNFKIKEFFEFVRHMGDDLNDRKSRFDKADLLEQALSRATGKQLEWVDRIGYDLIDSITGEKYEVKSQKGCLYTGKKLKKASTSKIKLKNTLQRGLEKKIEAIADWLIIIDTKNYSMGIIDYKTVVDFYTTELPDGFECQIPTKKLFFIQEIIALNESTFDVPSYRDLKSTLQAQYINNFFKETENEI